MGATTLQKLSGRCVAVLLGLALAAPAGAREARLLILHTNDLHDHLRPGAYEQGGLPYLAGYVRQVRAERSDVLMVDAGDVTEKGDMVAFKTQHRMTYEAMRQIGYDGVTIGNHDDDAGVPGLHGYEQVLGQRLLCLNLMKPDRTPEFPASRVVQVGELKVGLIGLIVPRPDGLDFAESGQALQREALRLRPEVHLIVALCHAGVVNCAEWSKMAPAVDVFVSGHTHIPLPVPFVVPETGAYIVQSVSYARSIGRLDLRVDLERKKILEAKGELVPLSHDTVPVDREMLDWVRRREAELCPEASEVLAQNPDLLDMDSVAWLGAEALRRQAKTDIGFCHVGQIIRSPIFPGPLDVNALFVAGGDRGDETVRTELSGAEINAYLEILAADKNDQTNWSGFKARVQSAPGEAARLTTDLVPDRTYTVIMPALEWNTRFLRKVALVKDKNRGGPLAARSFSSRPADPVSFTRAMRAYVAQLEAAKHGLKAEAMHLAMLGYAGPRAPSYR